MTQTQNKGSESHKLKTESLKLEQDNKNKYLMDQIADLHALLNSKLNQIDSMMEKVNKMDELTQKMDSFDEFSRNLHDKVTLNESAGNKLMESLKKAETKMDQSAKTLNKLKTMAGLGDSDDIGNMSASDGAGMFGSNKGRGESVGGLGEVGLTPHDLKRLSENMKSFEVGEYVSKDIIDKQYNQLLTMIKSQGEQVRNAFEGDVNPSSERLKNEIMKYIDDKLSSMPSQEMMDQ